MSCTGILFFSDIENPFAAMSREKQKVVEKRREGSGLSRERERGRKRRGRKN